MSDSVRSPTAMRRALGQRLRDLRLTQNLTVADAAAAIGISQSKLTKIELAQVVAVRADVDRIVEAFGGVDAEERDRLMEMVRDGNRREWWEGHAQLGLMPKFGAFLGLESVATVVQDYHPTMVYGLLQTPDYARAVIRGTRPDLLDHEVDQLVETRVRRQEILTREDPPAPTLWVVMDEAVLRRPIGGKETMHAQLERLAEASTMPNVNLLVIPDSVGTHAGLTGALSVLQFETGARPVAYVDCQAGNLYMERDDDLRRCLQVMTHILAVASGPEKSLALIRQAAEELKP